MVVGVSVIWERVVDAVAGQLAAAVHPQCSTEGLSEAAGEGRALPGERGREREGAARIRRTEPAVHRASVGRPERLADGGAQLVHPRFVEAVEMHLVLVTLLTLLAELLGVRVLERVSDREEREALERVLGDSVDVAECFNDNVNLI